MYNPANDPKVHPEVAKQWNNADPRQRILIMLLGNLITKMGKQQAREFIDRLLNGRSDT